MNIKLKNFLNQKEWAKPWLGVIVFFVFCIFFSPHTQTGIAFLKFDNLANVLRQVSEKGIISIGMTFVIIAGGIDLSVGAILGLAATLTAFGIMDWQLGLTFTVLLSLFSGAVAGLVNGTITAWGRMQSFISTLAMMTAARGFALHISGSTSRNIGFGINAAPESFKLFTTTYCGIPFPVFIFIGVSLIFFIILRKTRFGRYVYAIGSNKEAAVLAGLNVKWLTAITFIICGLLAGLSGIIHAAQLNQGNPNDGVGFELDAIAAVVIGGTSLAGGKGTIGGTFAGVIIIGLLNNIIGLNGINKDLTLIIQGVIIIAAVYIQLGPGLFHAKTQRRKVFQYTSIILAIIIIGGLAIIKTTKKSDKYVIGFSQCNSSEPWREAMNKEVVREAKLHPELEVIISDGNQDNSKQVADVENFIVRGINLLIISPNEAKPLTAVVEKAYRAGIPVIILDRKIASDSFTVFIGANNLVIGEAAGKYAKNLLKGNGRIVEIWGLKGSTPAQERHDGFIKGLDLPNNPGIELVYDQDAGWLREKGYKVMEDAVQRFEKIDLVYAHNDPMAIGAYLAAKNARREKQSYFIGIDGLPGPEGGVQAVIDKQLSATFLYPTGGKMAVQVALKILKDSKTGRLKESKIEKYITLSTETIDIKNADKLVK